VRRYKCRFGTVVAVCAIVTGLVGGVAPVVAQDAAAARVRLPQDHAYQMTLRGYLATLTEQDFTVELRPFAPPSVQLSDEELFRLRLLLLFPMDVRVSLRQPASQFTLASIEGEKGVTVPPVDTDWTAWLALWDYEGNPYHRSRPLMLRVFTAAAVDMIMHDNGHEKLGIGTRSDFLGGTLIWLAMAYQASRDALPAEVQAAYEDGLKKLVRRLDEWGPTRAMTDMDLFASVSMPMVADLVNDPEITQIAETYVRRLYTEPRFFDPAGYFVDCGCFDTSYNGISLFFATFAALQAPDWPFIRDALDRAYRLKSYLTFPDPDGNVFGPSQCSSRTSADPSHDQWDFGQRNIGASMVTDNALFLTKLPTKDELKAAPDAVLGMLNRAVEGEYTPADAPVWAERHWVSRYNYAYGRYVPGYYGRRAKLDADGSPLLQNPYLRGDDFIETFGKAFLIARRGDIAFAIHTGPVGGPMHGWGGGELCAFWTPRTGSVMLGRRRGWEAQTHQGDKADTWEGWRNWPVHAVTGVAEDGSVFSSSRIRDPKPAYTVQGGRARVSVAGEIPTEPTNGARPCLKGRVRYSRTFIAQDGALTIQTSVLSDGADRATELYETIPIFLREAAYQAGEQPTAVQFEVGGQWQEATPDLQVGVTAARLSRFGGAVVVRFAAPVRAKLSPEVWADSYQTRATCRAVLIDLLGTVGKPAPIRAASVKYTISAET
jgi:hypothetical protein